MAEQGLPALTVVLTKLHAGGKFGGSGYKVSGGLHGVGVSVVNALSEWLVAEVQRDGKTWRQEFARGEPIEAMKATGPTKATGTTISFLPDLEIFDELEWSRETLVHMLRETAFLTRGLRIVLVDEREGETRDEFHYEGGIRDFVAYVNQSKDPLHKHIVYFEGETDLGTVEVAMQWNALLRRVGVLVREQHQHARGRLAPVGLQGGAHRHAEQVRARQGPAQGEGGEPRGRGRPRGARRGDLREAPRPAVRGADEDEARQPVGAGLRRADGQPEAGRVPRGEPARTRARSSRRRSRPRGPARRRARRAS